MLIIMSRLYYVNVNFYTEQQLTYFNDKICKMLTNQLFSISILDCLKINFPKGHNWPSMLEIGYSYYICKRQGSVHTHTYTQFALINSNYRCQVGVQQRILKPLTFSRMNYIEVCQL